MSDAPKKLHIKTYGCQMNVYDSERMAEAMGAQGYVLTDDPAEADMVLLNTCHIREKAAEKVYSDLGRLRPFKEAKPDLKIGVVPVINLEWIQKIHRDRAHRGYTTEAVTDVILRRMHAYVHCITPQFTKTDINFQRVPVVDTSNPFVARWIPTADESLVVIRFRNPRGIDFPYLTSMIHGSWMSRANSIVIPGNKLDLAMQLILTPLIERLVRESRLA